MIEDCGCRSEILSAGSVGSALSEKDRFFELWQGFELPGVLCGTLYFYDFFK
jgi:hypothetical protein